MEETRIRIGFWGRGGGKNKAEFCLAVPLHSSTLYPQLELQFASTMNSSLTPFPFNCNLNKLERNCTVLLPNHDMSNLLNASDIKETSQKLVTK